MDMSQYSLQKIKLNVALESFVSWLNSSYDTINDSLKEDLTVRAKLLKVTFNSMFCNG